MKITADVRFSTIPEWLLLDRNVSDRAYRLWGLLDRYADNDGTGARASRATLAERLGCSVDTVDRATRELITAGAVSIEKRYTDSGDPDTNAYTLHVMPRSFELPHATARLRSRNDTATGGGIDSARGGRTDAAQLKASSTESQLNETPTNVGALIAANQRPLLDCEAIDLIRQVRGLDSITADMIECHLLDIFRAARLDVSPDQLRRESIKFRDYWQRKRANQPPKQHWRGWKTALTNWFTRVRPEIVAPVTQPDEIASALAVKNGVRA